MNSSSKCPEVTFTCSGVDTLLPSIQWFFDGEALAPFYHDIYPLRVELYNTTWGALIGGVDIWIVEVSFDEDDPDYIDSFFSTMTVNNISALEGFGVSTVSCGTYQHTILLSFHPLKGWPMDI